MPPIMALDADANWLSGSLQLQRPALDAVSGALASSRNTLWAWKPCKMSWKKVMLLCFCIGNCPWGCKISSHALYNRPRRTSSLGPLHWFWFGCSGICWWFQLIPAASILLLCVKHGLSLKISSGFCEKSPPRRTHTVIFLARATSETSVQPETWAIFNIIEMSSVGFVGSYFV